MSDITKTLHEQYRNDWEEAKSLLARAADEKRELTAEEEQRWDALNAAMSARKSKAYWAGYTTTQEEPMTEEPVEQTEEKPKKTKRKKAD